MKSENQWHQNQRKSIGGENRRENGENQKIGISRA